MRRVGRDDQRCTALHRYPEQPSHPRVHVSRLDELDDGHWDWRVPVPTPPARGAVQRSHGVMITPRIASMRALFFTGKQSVEVRDVETPKPGRGEALLRVKA